MHNKPGVKLSKHLDPSLPDVRWARNLCLAMIQRDMSQYRLQDICGISQTILSDYIRGKREPKATKLADLCKALGISMDWLMNNTSDDPSSGDAMIRESRGEVLSLEEQRLIEIARDVGIADVYRLIFRHAVANQMSISIVKGIPHPRFSPTFPA